MTKTWKKPQMCQVAAGFEITRYAEAEIAVRKDGRK
ncbi:pyrroloquinoline quinone precursor peptide PqqA [Antarcticirhabdus aurantiaca]